MGRPFSFAIAAGGERRLHQMGNLIAEETSITLAQLGLRHLHEVTGDVLGELVESTTQVWRRVDLQDSARPSPLQKRGLDREFPVFLGYMVWHFHNSSVLRYRLTLPPANPKSLKGTKATAGLDNHRYEAGALTGGRPISG